MSAFRRMLARILVCAVLVCLASFAIAQKRDRRPTQKPDELAVARALGPQWRQLSRTAGMIFAGTVLGVEALPLSDEQPIPAIELKFRVDRAIAGVHPGQVLTIREWAGAWSLHRPMRRGERLFLLLYPPSRLGLTSPVGGTLGQIALDDRGGPVHALWSQAFDEGGNIFPKPSAPNATSEKQTLSVRQLERAIRSAREE